MHDSEVANSWAGALTLMDAYRWHRLNPIKVHPEFGQATFDAVDYRFKAENRVDVERLSDWSSVCGIQKLSK